MANTRSPYSIRHWRGVLLPITQEYARDTTVCVLILSTPNLEYGRKLDLKKVLGGFGFSRLYILPIVTRVADVSILPSLPAETLVHETADEVQCSILRDCGIVVYATGDMPSQSVAELAFSRGERLVSSCAAVGYRLQVQRFERLTAAGNTLPLDEVRRSDSLVEY